MGRKTLNNVRSLIELVEKAPLAVIRAFCGLSECTHLVSGIDWTRIGDDFRPALLDRMAHLKKDQREPAEREALRVLRLASTRGAEVLSVVSQQLNDAELEAVFQGQDGAEIGRSVWMRTHSDDTLRLFDAAESIVNAGDIRGMKKLYDAFEVPCDDAPPFVWNDAVRKELEARLTAAMWLAEPCEVIHVQMGDDADDPTREPVHFLVVRFAGEMASIVQIRNRRKESFFYYPARDATIVYAPGRNLVEVCAQAHARRSILADVLSQHGFKRPLSNRPLNRFRYDLSRFAKGLKKEKPGIPGARVERLYLADMTSLLGNTTHSVTLRIDTTEDLQDVAAEHWGNHPFRRPDAILGVTLVAELAFEGETSVTPLVITLTEPNRCSLQGERDPRLRRCGEAILESLGVLKPLHPGSGVGDPRLVLQVATLLEHAHGPMDGIALAKLGIDIERFADEGIIVEGERINEIVVEVADDDPFKLKLERTNDPDVVKYVDPVTGHDVSIPANQARRWRIDTDWLRQELIQSLGKSLHSPGGSFRDDEPVFLGELDIDGGRVALYFASRLSVDRHFAKVDAALRLMPRPLPGIVLTTTPDPLPFAGTNIVVPVEAIIANGEKTAAIDLDQLAVRYRHGRAAAKGGSSIRISVSADGYSAVLTIPGKAPWRVTNKAKVAVLQRLVDAYHAGTPHVNTKMLMQGTGCSSPANLFPKTSPWREYLEKVVGAHAWQLRVTASPEVIEREDATEGCAA